MKTLQRLLLLILTMPLLASHCEKENFDILPPETQEGKNTFGCLVNGDIRVKGKVQFGYKALYASYSMSEKEVTINATLNVGKITIVVKNPTVNNPVFIDLCYYLPKSDRDPNIKCFCFGGKNIGEIVLTRFDIVNMVVSGHFNFDGQCSNEFVNPVGDSIVHITQGRFDIKLDVYD